LPGHRISKSWHYNPILNAPAKYRKACKYEPFIPDLLKGLPFTAGPEITGLISEAEGAIRSLNAVAMPALAPLARLLLRTESIASSKVEGIQLGARDLARAEARMESGRKVGSTALEILANINAMELAIQNAASAQQFTVDDITAIHHRLMENSMNAKIAGKIRTEQNWIGGNDYNPCSADFVPPPPEMIDSLLSDLCETVNDDVLPPLVQAALVHAQFETIHPFDDGNGRTGRALIHVVLRRREIAPSYVPPISVVLANTRERYIDGLTQFRDDQVHGPSKWIEYFAEAATRSARMAAAYLRAVHALDEQWRAQLSKMTNAPRSDATAWAIIDALPAHPIITAPVAAAVIGRSKPSIYEGIAALEAAGVLTPLSTSLRNQSWEAVGLLELLEGLETGDLSVSMS
jgi:Fic family protein